MPDPVADVTAAAWHALGLLVAHALYQVRMHAEQRAHVIRTGPAGTVLGAPGAAGNGTLVLWAALQVCATSHWSTYLTPTGSPSIKMLGCVPVHHMGGFAHCTVFHQSPT
jgi:hypothetical protein